MQRAGWTPPLYATLAAVLWGSVGVVFKLGLAHGASEPWMILGRPLLASLVSVAMALAGYGRPTRWSVVIGLLGLAPLYVSYFLAVERIGASLASLLLYTAPIWVAALSPVVVGERVGAVQALTVPLGVAGASLVSWNLKDAEGGVGGVMLGLASGASYAAYIVLARAAQKRGASVYEASIHAIPFATLGVAISVRPSSLPTVNDALFAAYLAVAGTVVPYFLHVSALKYLRATTVAVLSLIEPLTAVLMASALLGEELDLVKAAGAAMILAAALIASLEERSESKR